MGIYVRRVGMRKAYRRRSEDFKRRILQRVLTNRVDTFTTEHQWLSLIKVHELTKRYYNHNNTIPACWTDKIKFNEFQIKIKQTKPKQIRKRSITIKQRYETDLQPWNKGKTGIYSFETLEKISEAGRRRKGSKRKEGSGANIAAAKKGKRMKQESIDKMAATKRGQKQSEEMVANRTKGIQAAWDKRKAKMPDDYQHFKSVLTVPNLMIKYDVGRKVILRWNKEVKIHYDS